MGKLNKTYTVSRDEGLTLGDLYAVVMDSQSMAFDSLVLADVDDDGRIYNLRIEVK